VTAHRQYYHVDTALWSGAWGHRLLVLLSCKEICVWSSKGLRLCLLYIGVGLTLQCSVQEWKNVTNGVLVCMQISTPECDWIVIFHFSDTIHTRVMWQLLLDLCVYATIPIKIFAPSCQPASAKPRLSHLQFSHRFTCCKQSYNECWFYIFKYSFT